MNSTIDQILLAKTRSAVRRSADPIKRAIERLFTDIALIAVRDYIHFRSRNIIKEDNSCVPTFDDDVAQDASTSISFLFGSTDGDCTCDRNERTGLHVLLNLLNSNVSPEAIQARLRDSKVHREIWKRITAITNKQFHGEDSARKLTRKQKVYEDETLRFS